MANEIQTWKGALEPAETSPSGNEVQTWKGAVEPAEPVAGVAAGTVSVSAKGVPSIVGDSGTHTFDYKIRDLTDSKVSATYTVTINVT